MNTKHSKCPQCYQNHLPEAHDQGSDLVVSGFSVPTAFTNPPKQAGTTPSTELKEAINKVIVEIIDKPDHYCIAFSEGQACCIDPRVDLAEPGYGGEAQPELTNQLLALITQERNKAIQENQLALAKFIKEHWAAGDLEQVLTDRLLELQKESPHVQQ